MSDGEFAGSAPAAKIERLPRRTLALCVAWFALACLFAQFAIRIDYGPDEPYHLEYVHVLATEARLPTPEETHLVQHPPFYYLALAPAWRLLGGQRPLSVEPGPRALRHWREADLRARRLLRFASTLLGCLTLLVLASILAVVGAPLRWQGPLLFFAASLPLFQYMGAVVNNEGASILYSSVLCLAVLVRARAGTCSAREALLLGLLVGLATWVKQTALFAAPVAAWVIWTTAPRGAGVRCLALFAGGALATGIWWPLRNLLAVGTPFPCYTIPADQPTVGEIAAQPQLAAHWVLTILETSVLPDWSWAFIPRELSTVLALAGAALVLGLFLAGLRAGVPTASGERRTRALAVAALALLLAGIVQYCLFQDVRAVIGGRYALNGLPWLVAFLGASAPLIRPPEAFRQAGRLLLPVAGALTLFLVLSWWVFVQAWYRGVERLG